MVLGAQVALADAAAPPVDKPKWEPFASIGGKAGPNASGGDLMGFDPIWQDLNSLIYVRLGITAPTSRNTIGNFGIGYRTKLDSDWIGGVFGGLDFTSSNGRSYTQGSLGFEAMSADWDVRLNGYLSFDSKPADIGGSYSLFLHDTRIAILKEQEFAYSGFEGEVGYRIFNTDNFDIRVFGGAYAFNRDSTKASLGGVSFNLGPGAIAGPMGRAEFELHDLDIFGPQSRLTFTAEVSNDNVHGSTSYVGVALRIPLNIDGGDPAVLDDLDRRMVDPVRRRDSVMVESGFTKPEPVIIYNGTITSEPTNTLYYVDNSSGAGTYADPTTLSDATGRGPVNQFIVLTDRDGSVDATGVTVQHGETVAGPGVFKVRGVDSGTVFTHDFAPHSGPVTVSTADGITLDPDTRLYGFNINSTAPNAIYGHNVDDVVIGNVTIDGGGVGGNGIYIVQDAGTSGSVTISNSTITGVTNDGIKVLVDNSTGSTATTNINISNVDVDAGHDGISLVSTISGGSNETVYLGVHNSVLSGGNAPLYTFASASGGATFNGTTVVDPTYLTGGLYGFAAYSYANGGTVNQTIDLSQVYVSGTSYAGIVIGAFAVNGGSVTQSITMDIVDVVGSYYPVAVFAAAVGAGSSVEQTVVASHVSATNGYYDNFTFFNYAADGGHSGQYVTLADITAINSRYGSGLFLFNEAYEDATAIQSVDIYDLTATGNYGSGIYLRASATNGTSGASAVAAQYLYVTNSDISGNYRSGVTGYASGSIDSISRQDIFIASSTLDDNGGFGVNAFAAAGFYGAAEQHVYLFGNDISYNGVGGVAVNAVAFALGSVEQSLYMVDDYVYANGGDGISISATSYFAGQINQSANLYYVYSELNARDGLSISATAYGYGIGFYAYYSHISQNAIVAYSDFSGNLRNGVEVQDYAGYGGQLNQLVYLFDVGMNGNGPSGLVPSGAGNGLYVNAVAEGYGYFGGAITTNLYSDIYVVDSFANGNAADGLRFKGAAYGPTYLIQNIEVFGTNAGYNGRSGFVAYDYAAGIYSLNIQYLTLANSVFNNNGLDGAAFLATQYYGPLSFGLALQDISISHSDFSGNYRDGLYASLYASGFQGRAEQYFTIQSSRFDVNGLNGAEFDSYVGNGVYYAGYTCDQIQGLVGGCAIGRENIVIVGSQFDFNGDNGILVDATAANYGALYAASGRPAGQPTLVVAYSDVSNNGNDGLRIDNHVSADSYLYSYFLSIGSYFDGNAYHGVEVNTFAYSGSLALQKTVLYGVLGSIESSASFNAVDGVSVYTVASGATALQLVGLYGTYLYYNGDAGAKISGHAYQPTVAGTPGYVADPTVSVVGQYVNAYDSVFIGNGLGAAPGSYEGGLIMGSFAEGSHSVAQMYATVHHNSFVYNYLGLAQGGFASYAGAVNQSLDSEYNFFGLDYVGEFLLADARSLGFVTQSLYDYGNLFVVNGLGMGISADATTAGNVIQNLGIYGDIFGQSPSTGNALGGLAISTYAGGYAFGYSLYYSHVTQNLIAAFDSFNDNGGNGISISDTAFYGGTENLFRYFFAVQANGNDNDGIYAGATILSYRGYSFAFNTNITSSLYMVYSDFDGNGASGIDLRSYNYGPTYHPAFFGGYSYLIQNNFILATYAEGNGRDGLTVLQNASGVYGLNAQYFTISGSAFDYNAGAGAHLVSSDVYGPGGFGDTFQSVTISNSDFSFNDGDGINLESFATGRQGRAEQHVGIYGSTISYNGGDGLNIYASATDGVYIAGHPCTTAQGLAGGCAFVRQNVFLYEDAITHNAGNGVTVGTYADNYGAIYGASGRPFRATLLVEKSDISYNSQNGVRISNHISGASYLFQYAYLSDTYVDHNGFAGIYSSTYASGAGSSVGAFFVTYDFSSPMSVSYNGGSGIHVASEALGGAVVYNRNFIIGSYVDHNGGFGFDSAVAYADASSLAVAVNYLEFSTFNHNADGFGIYAIGPGAYSYTFAVFNEIAYNAFVGAYGESNFGAYEYIGIYSFGNSVHDNGTNYLFNAFGGSTQVLN